MQLRVNDRPMEVTPPWQQDSPLQVLRKAFGLTGAKFGCCGKEHTDPGRPGTIEPPHPGSTER